MGFAAGYVQSAVNAAGGAAVTLAVPRGVSRAIVVPSVAVRWRDDGTSPTAAVGMPIAAGQPMTFDSLRSSVKFIGQAGAGVLDVSFYA